MKSELCKNFYLFKPARPYTKCPVSRLFIRRTKELHGPILGRVHRKCHLPSIRRRPSTFSPFLKERKFLKRLVRVRLRQQSWGFCVNSGQQYTPFIRFRQALRSSVPVSFSQSKAITRQKVTNPDVTPAWTAEPPGHIRRERYT